MARALRAARADLLDLALPELLRRDAVGGLRIVAADPGEMARPERSGDRALATGISGLRRAILVIAVLWHPRRPGASPATKRVLCDARLPATIAVTAALLSWLTTDLLVVSSLVPASINPAILLGRVAAGVILVINIINALLECAPPASAIG